MRIRSALRAPSLLAIVLLLAGCLFHGERNAPGRVDLRRPPKKIAARAVETPDDPGERFVTLSTGAAFGGGPRFNSGGGTAGAYALSVETSLHYGTRARSHRGDSPPIPLLPLKHYPFRSIALNLGWTLLERDGGGGAGVGPGYVEVQLFMMKALISGFAAGWAFDVAEETHGPQLTVFSLGFLWIRATTMFGRGVDLLFGVQAKLPVSWVWSR